MMKYFSVVRENPNEKYDISFEVNNELTEMEMDAQELYIEIEKTLNIIKNLDRTSNDTKDRYFNKLLSLSQVAFVSGKPSSVELANGSLEILKSEITMNEAQRIKNRYMTILGISSVVSIIICWVVYFLFDIPNNLQIYFMVWTGSMIGVWISFGARKFNIVLEDLSKLEEDEMSIYIRLPYIGICALTFLLFLKSGLFSFSIGDSSITSSLDENVEVQLLFGLVAGLFESKLGVKIYEKANNIVKNGVDK